ncbi:ABC transporter permease [Lactobacillus sp. ESL0261]|nr:ABC transporter permease [Lactobacillus sp. ESL0261]
MSFFMNIGGSMKKIVNVFNAVFIRSIKDNFSAYGLSLVTQRVVSLLVSLLLPLSLYFFVFNQQVSSAFKRSSSSNYVLFLFLGFIAYSASFSLLMSIGRSIVTEFRQGTFQYYIYSGANLLIYLVAVSLTGIILSFLESVILFIFLFITNSQISFLQLIIGYGLIIFSSISIAVFVGSIMLFFNNTYLVQNTISVLISFLCGISFPIKFLPKWVQYISEAIPLTSALDIFRNKAILINIDLGKMI